MKREQGTLQKKSKERSAPEVYQLCAGLVTHVEVPAGCYRSALCVHNSFFLWAQRISYFCGSQAPLENPAPVALGLRLL